MFEQATLTNGPAGKRALTTLLGMTSQVAFVSLAVLAPMVWPQVLPTMRLWESLAPPVPPGPKPLGDEPKARPARMVKVWREAPSWRYEPPSIPRDVLMLQEEPVEIGVVTGGQAGSMIGPPTGVLPSLLSGLTDGTARMAPPLAIPKPVAKPAVEAAPAIQRYKQGGLVQLGRVLHKGEPQYPAMAKSARITGDVVLECVVGVNGHIQEVKVKSGNPLLVRAAVDAAWQWVYEPSQLNATPIEIITYLTFSFKLN